MQPSSLPRIKSSLQTFMQPIFPQDSLQDPFKYFEDFIECCSLLEPKQSSTFHVDFVAFLQCSNQKTDTSLIKLIPNDSPYRHKFLLFGLCAKWPNAYYQQCIAPGDENLWMSLFSLDTMVLNNIAKHSEKIKSKK